MSKVRTEANCLRNAMDEAKEWEPTYRLDDFIAQERERMGEDRWREAMAEWEREE